MAQLTKGKAVERRLAGVPQRSQPSTEPESAVVLRFGRKRGRHIPGLRLRWNGLPLGDRLVHGVVMRVLRLLLIVARDSVLAVLRGLVGVLLVGQRAPLLFARAGAAPDPRAK